MKAIVWTKYGPPEGLQLREVAKPAPLDHEVLIRIHATTVTAADAEFRRFKIPILLRIPLRIYLGLRRPKNLILGQELAGEIEAVGKDVTRFKVGDQVFAWTAIRLGAYAEYKSLPEKSVISIKPPNISYEEAATLPVGGLEAAHFMLKGNLRPGEKVLINGAGGSIGTYAVQIARHLGAEVTAVDSTRKLDLLRSLGANHVVDYTREDFTRRGETYDVIFDVIGKASFTRSIKALGENGRLLLGNPRISQRLFGGWIARRSGRQVIPWTPRSAAELAEELAFLKELLEAGKIRPVVDRCFPLEQTAEAHRYVEGGHKKGNVVITVGRGSE